MAFLGAYGPHFFFEKMLETCSNSAQTAAPLIVLGSIISLGGGVVAYIYKFRYDAINAYYEEQKGRLFILINQGTMVVSGMAVLRCK